ncbi:Uncharacterised protein [Enterobacter cloacae]|nr:Uncharacterised protein [Enterobacter cloacae]
MHTHNHHAAVLHLGTFQVIQTFHVKPFTDTLVWPEPGHTGFKQRHTDRFKVFRNQRFALLRIVMRKAKFEIFSGNGLTTLKEVTRCAAELRTQETDHGIRKLNQQPKYAKAKPRKPVARVQKRPLKFGLRQNSGTYVKPVKVAQTSRYHVPLRP